MTAKSNNSVGIVSASRWDRIQSSLNEPPAKRKGWEKEEYVRKYVADMKELKKQEMAQLPEKLKFKLLQQEPCLRTFNSNLATEYALKQNDDLISIRRQLKQKKTVSVRSTNEEDMKALASFRKAQEDEARHRRLRAEEGRDYNLQAVTEKKRRIEWTRDLERQEEQAFLLKNQQEIQKQKEDMADLKKRNKHIFLDANPLMSLRKKQKIKRKRSEEEEEKRKRIQMNADAMREKRKNEQEMPRRLRQVKLKTASDVSAAIQKEWATRRSLLEERAYNNAVAERDAKAAKKLKEDRERKLDLITSHLGYLGKQVKQNILKRKEEKKERFQPSQSIIETDKYVMEKKQKLENEKDGNLSLCNVNRALGEERRERRLDMKKAEEEALRQFLHPSEEKVKAVKNYVCSELVKAKDLGLNVGRLLKSEVETHGMFEQDKQPKQLYGSILTHKVARTLEPLPHFGNDKIREIKLLQAIKNMDPTMTRKKLRPIKPMTKGRVIDLFHDDNDKYKPSGFSKTVLPPIRDN